MLKLRPYQEEAVEAVFDYWGAEGGNPLVDLATGCGKSAVLSEIIKRLCEGWPDMRILVVTHVAELIEQSYLELLGMWPFAPAGIFSAGLGRRDRNAQVLFCGIQTVWNKVDEICRNGAPDVMLVDEAHLIPAKAETMYGKFIDGLRERNPDMKIVGLTATPFRLDSGRLDEGDDRLFDRVVYEYGIGPAVRDGYLAPLSSKPTAAGFDLSGVGRIGGDYNQKKLQAATDKEEVTRAAVDEIVAKGADRKSWLIFGAGVEHALHIRDEIRARGISCETITGETPKEERRRIIEDFKAYRLRAITNNSVLTTGFNHKGVDLIAFMRPTLSAALYLQMAGRGVRVLYAPGMPLDTVEQRKAAIAAGPKPDCLVLDFAGLVAKHGPVDMVEPKKPGKGEGEAPIKICPECEELLHASVRVCTCCGYEFPPSEEAKHQAHASDAPILSTEEPVWRQVTGRKFQRHEKVGGLPSVRVDYSLGLEIQKDWICPGRGGYAGQRADRYWINHGGQRPFPKNPDEFLARAGELAITTEVRLKKNGRYWNVDAWKAGSAPANDNVPVPANDNAERERLRALAGKWDEVPF